jgi:hypothetical protein
MEGGHAHGGSGLGGMGATPAPKPATQAQPSGWQLIQDAFNTLLAIKPMDPGGFSTFKLLTKGSMCTDCTVLAGKMSIVFENGTRADISSGVYLHHAIAIDLNKRQDGFVTMCPPNVTAFGKPLKGNIVNTFIGGAVVSTCLHCEVQKLTMF